MVKKSTVIEYYFSENEDLFILNVNNSTTLHTIPIIISTYIPYIITFIFKIIFMSCCWDVTGISCVQVISFSLPICRSNYFLDLQFFQLLKGNSLLNYSGLANKFKYQYENHSQGYMSCTFLQLAPEMNIYEQHTRSVQRSQNQGHKHFPTL